MILSEPLRQLEQFDTTLDVIVRSDDTIADISDVTEDFDHTDDSRFISIDLENRTEQGVEADAESRCIPGCENVRGDQVCQICKYY